MSHYLIQNPLHEYGVELMKRIQARFGYTPICLFTDPKRRYYHERRYPELARLAPDTRCDASLDDLPALAARLRARYPKIVGLVPFYETSLDAAPRLLELFGLSWNSREVLARFRDKSALKAHLSRARPGLRLNRQFLVRSPQDLDVELPARFVLKPNDGFGSAGVGVFTRQTPRAELARFLAASPGRAFILEEWVEGVLHTVDGQVDENGKAHVAAVFTSGRTSANGSDVVYTDGRLIHQDTGLFRDLAAYASEVLEASGLRRCPFHMEVMVDAQGPCLIEVGARLIGHGHVRTLGLVHRGRFDFFDVAAHGYLSDKPYGELGFDWAHYNAVQAIKIYGVSRKAGLVARVRGVEAVERLPEFKRWIVKPGVGQKLARTTDLSTVPYSLVLIGRGTLPELEACAEAVHRMLELDVDGSPASRAWRRLARLLKRAPLVLGWLATKAARRIKRAP
jgi:hypothetical protein